MAFGKLLDSADRKAGPVLVAGRPGAFGIPAPENRRRATL